MPQPLDHESTPMLAALDREPGPLVIVARPRSGTRLLAEILGRAGVFMGAGISSRYLDSEPRYRGFVFPLIVSNWFSDWDRHWGDERFRRFCRERLDETLCAYLREGTPRGPWGWKIPEALCVRTARGHGRIMPESYHEVRYERLRADPVLTIRALFERLDLAVTPELERFLMAEVRSDRVQKWERQALQGAEAADFRDAVRLGMPLLEELGA